MKLLKVVVLVALTYLVGHAQERSMADATYALKGPVRSFRVEVATFVSKDGDYVEGPRVAQMEASFNQDGNRTDLHIYNEKGVLNKDGSTKKNRMLQISSMRTATGRN